MDENSRNNASTSSADKGSSTAKEDAQKAALKKRRSWLGVKSAFSTGSHGEDYQPVSYGDGHSGWNR